MPHSTIKMKPGVDIIETPALSEVSYQSTNLARWIPDVKGLGLVQKMGGWLAYYTSAFSSKIRALKGWADLEGNNYLGIGAENSLEVLSGSSQRDITPQTLTTNSSPNFSTTINTNIVVVVDAGITASTVNYVYYATPVSVGGLILTGSYPLYSAAGNTYSILAETNATSTVVSGGASYAFTTVSGTSVVAVTFADHGLAVGETIYVSVPTTVGGVTISGLYSVISLGNQAGANPTTQFCIATSAVATSTAGPTAINSGNIEADFFLATGPAPTSTGFGVGGYGVGGFGAGTSSTSTFDGSISGSTLTVTSLLSGTIIAGQTLSATGILAGTSIVSGTYPTYTVTNSQTLGPVTFTGSLYSTGTSVTTNDWSLDNYGQDLVACPVGGPIYYWQPNGRLATAQILGQQVPLVNEGMFVAMPERQIVAYGSSFSLNADPLNVRWCDAGDPTVWIANSINQAGSYRIPSGSKIVAGIQGPQQGLLWTDLDIWAMQYVGLPFVYGFNKIGTNCGAISRKCVGTLNSVVYWMSQRQFYMMSGNGVTPLPCSVWDTVFQNLKQGVISTDPASIYYNVPYTDRIRCAVNSQFNEIMWFFPSANGNGENDTYVKYNTVMQCWDYGSLGRTAWIDQSVLGPPIGAGTDNFLYKHETGNNISVGTTEYAMPTSMRTGYAQLNEADNIIFIDQIWPDMDWGIWSQSTAINEPGNATVNLTIYATNYPWDTPTAYGPFPMNASTQYISCRIRARLIAFELSSDDINSFWRLGAIRYRYQLDGRY